MIRWLALLLLCAIPAQALEFVGGPEARLPAAQLGPATFPVFLDTVDGTRVDVIHATLDGAEIDPGRFGACLEEPTDSRSWRLRLSPGGLRFPAGVLSLKLAVWSADPDETDICGSDATGPPFPAVCETDCAVMTFSLTVPMPEPTRGNALLSGVADGARRIGFAPDGTALPVLFDLFPADGVDPARLDYTLTGTLSDGTRAADAFALDFVDGPALRLTPTGIGTLSPGTYTMTVQARLTGTGPCPAQAGDTPLDCQSLGLQVTRPAATLRAPAALVLTVDRAASLLGGEIEAPRFGGLSLTETGNLAPASLPAADYVVRVTEDTDATRTGALTFATDTQVIGPGGSAVFTLDAAAAPAGFGTYNGTLDIAPGFGSAAAVSIPVRLVVRVWWGVHLAALIFGVFFGTVYRAKIGRRLPLIEAQAAAARLRRRMLGERRLRDDPAFSAAVDAALLRLALATDNRTGDATAEGIEAAISAAEDVLAKAIAEHDGKARLAADGPAPKVEIVPPETVYPDYPDVWSLRTPVGSLSHAEWFLDGIAIGSGTSPVLSLPHGGTVTANVKVDNAGTTATREVTLSAKRHRNDPDRLWWRLWRIYLLRSVLNGVVIVILGMVFLQTVAAGLAGILAAFLWGVSADVTAAQLSGAAKGAPEV